MVLLLLLLVHFSVPCLSSLLWTRWFDLRWGGGILENAVIQDYKVNSMGLNLLNTSTPKLAGTDKWKWDQQSADRLWPSMVACVWNLLSHNIALFSFLARIWGCCPSSIVRCLNRYWFLTAILHWNRLTDHRLPLNRVYIGSVKSSRPSLQPTWNSGQAAVG